MGITGTSDPFVTVFFDNQKATTTVIAGNLNPIWNEILTFTADNPKSPIFIVVMDKGRFKSDDLEGRCELSLERDADLQADQQKMVVVWRNLVDQDGNQTRARLRIGCEYISDMKRYLTEKAREKEEEYYKLKERKDVEQRFIDNAKGSFS